MTITPRYDYDHGKVTLTFRAAEAFAASTAAEAWLRGRGFSVGPMQGDEPRGIFRGDGGTPIVIGKWRTLVPLAREALHGVMIGDGRSGPVQILIFADAPADVREAIVMPLDDAARPARIEPTRGPDLFATCGVLAGVLCLIALLFVGPPSPPPDGKITLRAERVAFGKLEPARWELRK